MKLVVRVAMCVAVSLFFAGTPALADSGPKKVPVPIAGAGLIGLAGMLYLGRKFRCKH